MSYKKAQKSDYLQYNDKNSPSSKAGVAGSAKSWDENVGIATSEQSEQTKQWTTASW